MRVWSVGEVLWDVFPDEERFGGAPLNFCANLRRMNDQADLISAVGNDDRGRLALKRMRALGLSTRWVKTVQGFATGTALIHTSPDGEPAFVIPRPAAFDMLTMEDGLESNAEQPAWLYYGTLAQMQPAVAGLTTALAGKLSSTRRFYDMNLREGQWTLELVQRLSAITTVLKLNEAEAETLFAMTRSTKAKFSLELFCDAWAERYGIEVICVTLGAKGCLVYERGVIHRVEGYSVTVRDTVGSGDAFAAAFLHGYQRGWPVDKAAQFANALGALVASRAGATPEWSMDECLALMQAKQ
jgi:fructokinase